MKKDKITQIIDNIDEKFISEASAFFPDKEFMPSNDSAACAKNAKNSALWLKWVIAAASLVFIAAVGFTVSTVVMNNGGGSALPIAETSVSSSDDSSSSEISADSSVNDPNEDSSVSSSVEQSSDENPPDSSAPIEEKKFTKGLSYELNADGESYSVVGLGSATDTAIFIPDTYDGKPVTCVIANVFIDNNRIVSVTLGENVSSVEYKSPSGTSDTGAGAGGDQGPYNLFELPELVSGGALSYSDYGNAHYFGNEENPYVLLIRSNDKTITSCQIHEDAKMIGMGAFRMHNNLTEVDIPDGVRIIGHRAFESCSDLERLTIGNGVESIGEYAFYNCSNLESLTIGNGVESIGAYAFRSCDKIIYNEYENACYSGNEENPYLVLMKAKDTSISSCEINENTKIINGEAFSNCTELTDINIPDSVISIGMFAFHNCRALTSVVIHYGVKSIPEGMFNSCIGLKSVTIPDSVTSIGSVAFGNCRELERIVLPDSITSIGSVAFRNCFKLESIVLPDGITSINTDTFKQCEKLTSIVIPKGVTSIGAHSFDYCNSLSKVYYCGSIEDWDGITIDAGSSFVGAQKYYYSEEEPTTEGFYWHYVDGEIVEW